jgi:GxxExxY protein
VLGQVLEQFGDAGVLALGVEGEHHISVEIKAVIQLEDVHLAQAINYLEAYNLEVGLLINFGSKCLESKRVMNKKYQSPS